MVVGGLGPPMAESPKAWRYEALLREAAQSLADTIAPYRVLTRADLAGLAGVDRWRSVDFDKALECALALGLLRRLPDDFYETPDSSRSATAE